MPARARSALVAVALHAAVPPLAGAVLTVASAGALAARARAFEPAGSMAHVEPAATTAYRWQWTVEMGGAPGITRWSTQCHGPHHMTICGTGMMGVERPPPVTPPAWLVDRLAAREAALTRAHADAVTAGTEAAGSYNIDIYHDDFAGWPLPAVHAETRTAYNFTANSVSEDVQHVRFGIELPSPPARGGLTNRVAVIPLEPMWPGFAVNTAFYGAIAWALLFAKGTILRIVRRRRGRCVSCGYDRRGLDGAAACPECGRAPSCHGLAAPGQSVPASR